MLDDPDSTTGYRPDARHDPLRPLLDDHTLARTVLGAMEAAALRERVGHPVDVSTWHRVLAFFDDYFDGVHHPKEDELLLPLLHRAGFAAPGSAAARMQQEHERMAPFREHLRHAVDARAPSELRATVQAFVSLHRRHMALEEQHVFPMVRAVFATVTQHELQAAFEALDHVMRPCREHAHRLVTAILTVTRADDPHLEAD
ncbi:MAG: hemerythrin domain-containing protein [Planctomycetota bacterium]